MSINKTDNWLIQNRENTLAGTYIITLIIVLVIGLGFQTLPEELALVITFPPLPIMTVIVQVEKL